MLIKLQKRKQEFTLTSKDTIAADMSIGYSFQMTNFSCLLLFRFNDETGSERKILPQYDDPVADEVKFMSCFSKKSLVFDIVHISLIRCFLAGNNS